VRANPRARWVSEHGEPPTQKELADQAGTDAMMTAGVVAALGDEAMPPR
jgi:hypothetical protein